MFHSRRRHQFGRSEDDYHSLVRPRHLCCDKVLMLWDELVRVRPPQTPWPLVRLRTHLCSAIQALSCSTAHLRVINNGMMRQNQLAGRINNSRHMHRFSRLRRNIPERQPGGSHRPSHHTTRHTAPHEMASHVTTSHHTRFTPHHTKDTRARAHTHTHTHNQEKIT